MEYPWHTEKFSINKYGRDFVAGDLHGEFERLETALTQLEFDFDHDRLFCIGDLIDRGPQSFRVSEFLQYHWFYSIAGNHEWMLYNCHADKRLSKTLWFPNGGDWWLKVDENTKAQILESIKSSMSALISIETNHRKVGLVHALAYPYYDWDEFCLKIVSDQVIQQWALWERDFEALTDKTVNGIDLILCGHTPIDKPLSFSNFINIDTGCGHQPSYWLAQPALTIVELSQKLEFYRFS